MVDHPAARALTGYLLVRGGVHQVAYARAVENLTGADLMKLFPAPRIPTDKIPECQPHIERGEHPKLYRFSPSDYHELAAVFNGPHPETGDDLVVVDDAPEGFAAVRPAPAGGPSSPPTTRPRRSPRSPASCARPPACPTSRPASSPTTPTASWARSRTRSPHEGPDVARQARRPRRHGPRPDDPGSRPTRSSGSRRPGCAARTCTCTRCSARSSTRATSSATSRWASSRRSAREVTDIAPGDRVVDPVQHLLRALLHVRPRPAVAVRDDAGPRAGHGRRRCSATRSSTARSPAGRPSSCACRRRSTGRSRSPTARPTTASCSSPTSCRPRGRRCEYADVPDGRHARRDRARPDRRDVRAGSPSTAAPSR